MSDERRDTNENTKDVKEARLEPAESATSRFLEEVREATSDRNMGIKTESSAANSPGRWNLPDLFIDQSKENPKKDDDAEDPMLKAKRETKGWDESKTPLPETIKDMVGDNDVIFWGEDHQDKNSADQFAKTLQALADSGVGAVALEGVRKGADADQINKWLNGDSTVTTAQIRDLLEKNNLDGAQVDKLMNILDAIKGMKPPLKVLGLEQEKGDFAGKGKPGEDCGAAKVEEGGADMSARERSWNETVDKYLASDEGKGKKVVVFGGSSHFTHTPEGKSYADHEHHKTVDFTPPYSYKPGGSTKVEGTEGKCSGPPRR